MTGRRRNVAADLKTWHRVHFFVQVDRLKMKGKQHAKGDDGAIGRAAKKFHKSTRQIERILAKYTPMTAVHADIRLKFQAVDTALATATREAFTRVGTAISEIFTTSVKPVMDDYATIKRNLTEIELSQITDVAGSSAFSLALGMAKDRERLNRLAQRKRKVTDKK